jgi:glutamine---fructose-6-phosphate transaminase (isomerizing)
MGSSTGDGPAPGRAGHLTAAEIAEQPRVLAGILRDGLPAIRGVAEVIRARGPRFVLFTARGTSDNAALYAKYLVEIGLGLPAGLTSPSTTTVYGARPDLRDVLVVAVSQSGGSPDLVESTAVARECGALTLAVTNEAGSPLARAAELHLDVLAGPEKALPATKTYTAQLLTLWLLVDAWRGGDAAAARPLPDLAAGLLARGTEVSLLAGRYRFADRLVTTARGYAYPTAREAALKLMETSYLATLPYSGADLLHGPLALVDAQSPVVAIVPSGRGGAAMAPVVERLRERGADICVVGSADAVAAASTGLVPPPGVDEDVSPVLEILPLQLLTYEVAMGRGIDPDSPRALAKVTETR